MKSREIISLYRRIIHTGINDSGYRAKLIHELLGWQKDDGSFSVIDDYKVDSDARVDYVYFTTYYATAALMFAMNADGVNATISEALTKGLAFAKGRRLVGHGFDATAQQLEALRVYKGAGLYDWLRTYGNDYPEFEELIKSIIEKYRNCLLTGNVYSDWQVNFSEDYQKEINDYEDSLLPNVWYACYGSNMSYERFMRYINNCTDKTAPVKSKAVTIPYDIYFAGKSQKWRGLGKAILDDTNKGHALGRMYLITNAQFSEIQRHEGSDYTKKILLGMEDGVPVYTFASEKKIDRDKSPDSEYVDTILKGLKETYPEMSDIVLSTYLYLHGVLSDNERKVLSFIRCSEHGVSLRQISDNTIAITNVKKAVKVLSKFGFIRQDSRSINEGHKIDSPEAVVYTNKEKRDLIDMIGLLCR
ncbi:MAG: hypothetical protein Q4C42_12000 [Clostridia bacterium]|nr:hypothetical protein [Clostridia bacterium]